MLTCNALLIRYSSYAFVYVVRKHFNVSQTNEYAILCFKSLHVEHILTRSAADCLAYIVDKHSAHFCINFSEHTQLGCSSSHMNTTKTRNNSSPKYVQGKLNCTDINMVKYMLCNKMNILKINLLNVIIVSNLLKSKYL